MQESGFGPKGSEDFFWGMTLPNGLRQSQKHVLTTIPGIICPDHIAFIATPLDLMYCELFWEKRGFGNQTWYRTIKTPASHTVFSPEPGVQDCRGSVVITIPENIHDDSLPNRLLRVYGKDSEYNGDSLAAIPQHYALEVAEDTTMADVIPRICAAGFVQIAEVLESTNAIGATLEQTFFAPQADPSPLHLVELVKRVPGRDGVYLQFDAPQIDEIYQRFDAHARSLGI